MSLLLALLTPATSDDLSRYSIAKAARRRVIGRGQVWVDNGDAAVAADDAPIYSTTLRRSVRRVPQSSEWINPDYFDELSPVSPAIRGKPKRSALSGNWADLEIVVAASDDLSVISVRIDRKRAIRPYLSRSWTDAAIPTPPDLSEVFSGGWPIYHRARKRKHDEDDEQQQQVEAIAIEHVIKRTKVKHDAPFLTLEQIIGAKQFAAMGKKDLQKRLDLEAKVQEVQRRMRSRRDDDELMLFH